MRILLLSCLLACMILSLVIVSPAAIAATATTTAAVTNQRDGYGPSTCYGCSGSVTGASQISGAFSGQVGDLLVVTTHCNAALSSIVDNGNDAWTLGTAGVNGPWTDSYAYTVMKQTAPTFTLTLGGTASGCSWSWQSYNTGAAKLAGILIDEAAVVCVATATAGVNSCTPYPLNVGAKISTTTASMVSLSYFVDSRTPPDCNADWGAYNLIGPGCGTGLGANLPATFYCSDAISWSIDASFRCVALNSYDYQAGGFSGVPVSATISMSSSTAATTYYYDLVVLIFTLTGSGAGSGPGSGPGGGDSGPFQPLLPGLGSDRHGCGDHGPYRGSGSPATRKTGA